MSRIVVLFGILCVLTESMDMEFHQQQRTSEPAVTHHGNEVQRALSRFAASLYKVTCSGAVGSEENTVISPFSIVSVLSMVHAGSKERTSQELKDVLNISEIADHLYLAQLGEILLSLKGADDYVLDTANQIYIMEKYKILEGFQALIKQHFRSSVETMNFGESSKASAAINKWVEKMTHNKIKNLIPDGALNEFTRLVLINAVYFKGTWQLQFDPSQTRIEPFYPGIGEDPVNVNMMHSKANYNVGMLQDLNATVLELPYKGGAVSMFIILPNTPEDMGFVEAAMQSHDLLELVKGQMRSEEVKVAIPKFDIAFSPDLKDALQKLGLREIFDEKKANLSGITGSNELFVSDVFHKAFIEINEEGSEAAAATAAVVRLKRSLQLEQSFIVDHPCIFIVQHKPSGLWLFTGRLNKPNQAAVEAKKHEEL